MTVLEDLKARSNQEAGTVFLDSTMRNALPALLALAEAADQVDLCFTGSYPLDHPMGKLKAALKPLLEEVQKI